MFVPLNLCPFPGSHEDKATDTGASQAGRAGRERSMRPILKSGGRKRSPNKSPNGSASSPAAKRPTEFTSPSGRRVTFSPFAKAKRRLQPKQLQKALDESASSTTSSGFAFDGAAEREKKRLARRKHDMSVLQNLFKAASKPRLSLQSLMDDHLALLQTAHVKISHWLHILKKPFMRSSSRTRRIVRSRTRHAPLVFFDPTDRQYAQSVCAPLLPTTSGVSLDHAHRSTSLLTYNRSMSSPSTTHQTDPRVPSFPMLTPIHHGSLSTLLRREGISAAEDDWNEQAAVDNDLRGVTHRSTGLKIVPHNQELRVVNMEYGRFEVTEHLQAARKHTLISWIVAKDSFTRETALTLKATGARSGAASSSTEYWRHLLSTLWKSVPPPPSYGPTRRYFFLGTSMHNRIPAFYLNQDNAEYTILFSHGNAEDLGMIYDWFREVGRRLCVNVMAYDYSGYGLSEGGEPSEEAVYSDVEAAFAFLVNVKNTPPNKIIVYGRSLGSGPTTYIAVKQSRLNDPVAGVILQSPLLSIFRVAFNFRFTIPGDLFCNVDIMDEVESPVTIIHGTRDEVVPFWHGEGLFEKCRQEWRCKPLWVTDAGHNNIEAFLSALGDEFFMHLIEFVTVCRETAATRAPVGKSSLA